MQHYYIKCNFLKYIVSIHSLVVKALAICTQQ